MIGPDATARADLASAVDQANALELQLRGPDGAIIATEDIGIVDTHYLLSVAESALDDADVPDDADEDAEANLFVEDGGPDPDLVSFEPGSEEETNLPRYQSQIELVDRDAVP